MDLIFRLMSSTTFKFELNSKPNKQGLHSILLRVTYEKKHTRFNSGIATKKNLFRSNANPINKNWVKDGDPQHEQKNDGLSTMLSKYIKLKDYLITEERIPSGENIRELLKEQQEAQKEEEAKQAELKELESRGEAPDSFLHFYKGSLDYFQKVYKWSNYVQFQSNYNLLKAFNDQMRKGKDLKFKDMNEGLLSDFEKWLLDGGFSPESRQKEKKERRPNTVQTKFRKLSVVIKKAIKEGKIQKAENPFLYFNTKGNKSKRTKLTLEEIVQIENLELPKGSHIEEARNAFLFSFYCAGIRVSDLLNMTWANVQDGRLVYTMIKTQKPMNMVLRPEAKAILDKLNRATKNKHEKLFKFLDRVKQPKAISRAEAEYKKLNSATSNYNKYLKSIEETLRLENHISSHISRHSFADFARRKKVPLPDIKNMLGHSDVAITANYFKQDDIESTDEALMSLDFSNNTKG